MSKLLEVCKVLGLHPIVGFGIAAVDWMLFAAEGATLGAIWPIAVAVGVVLGIASVLVQKYGFKEGWGLACVPQLIALLAHVRE